MDFGTGTPCFMYFFFYFIREFWFCFILFQPLHPFYRGYSDAAKNFCAVIYCVENVTVCVLAQSDIKCTRTRKYGVGEKVCVYNVLIYNGLTYNVPSFSTEVNGTVGAERSLLSPAARVLPFPWGRCNAVWGCVCTHCSAQPVHTTACDLGLFLLLGLPSSTSVSFSCQQ